MSNTRLTVVALLSRPSYLPSPPTNGRTQGRTCPPTRRKRAFDRRRKGVWRRRQNTGKKERKKGFVTVADIDAAVRLSAAINARCVRASVRVCFAPGSRAELSWLRCALRPSFAPPFFSSLPPIFNPSAICFCLDLTLLCSRRSFLRDWI